MVYATSRTRKPTRLREREYSVSFIEWSTPRAPIDFFFCTNKVYDERITNLSELSYAQAQSEDLRVKQP